MPNEPSIAFDPIYGPKLFLRSPDGSLEKEIYLTNDGRLNIDSDKYIIVNGTNEIVISLSDTSKPYLKRVNSDYGVMSYFIFNGTDILGQPSSIKVLSWVNNDTKQYSIRIVRTDTGAVVAEMTNQNNTTIQIKDLGSISNLPVNSTIFEIQGKATTGGECMIASLSIQF